ncbi:MAG: dehalogenase [Chloroflexi bacterium]|nr:dehalogenase [Chloroflexota bacterium]
MFFVGVVFTMAVAAAVALIIVKKVSVRWWEWLIFGIGVALLIFTVQNFIMAFGEQEPQAAWMFWLFTGLPALIIIAIPAILVFKRLNN